MCTRRHVAVGSTNPVKVAAVERAMRLCFPDLAASVAGVSAPSGVSDQPMGDEETKLGAVNRARAAAAAFEQEHGAPPAFAVGLEGGVADLAAAAGGSLPGGLECFAWMAVWAPADDRWGAARTGSFLLPPRVTELVRGGMELGLADDEVFGRSNSKQQDGAVGLLTRGVIDRAAYYEHALVLALVPHVSSSLY